ncbi:hypothetical protein ACFXK0_02805 [Nocardia sp. NPDC059177]|uniref:hypothetical protein n=1 Tax=Nocardia sp. NPDC059177 TaxID=3346759 RepID=UPI0036B4BA73
MDDSRAKVVGPAIAVGAVSLGLIIIGACGVGQQDVYVPPPPIEADLAVAPAPIADEVTSTTSSRVSIPPSPSWRIAPHMSPRKPFSLSSTETTPSEPPTEGAPSEESRPSEATTESQPPETTVDDQPVTTTRPRITTRPSPTRTIPPRTTTPRTTTPRFTIPDGDTEITIPTTRAYDNGTPTPTDSADTGATPTPAATGELTDTEATLPQAATTDPATPRRDTER